MDSFSRTISFNNQGGKLSEHVCTVIKGSIMLPPEAKSGTTFDLGTTSFHLCCCDAALTSEHLPTSFVSISIILVASQMNKCQSLVKMVQKK